MPGEIWLDLLNSDWHDYLGSGRSEDRLEDPAWLREYLGRHGIDAGGIPRDRLVASFRDLRTLMRRIADAYVRRAKVQSSDWNALNQYFSRVPLIRKVEIAGLERAGAPRDARSSPRPRRGSSRSPGGSRLSSAKYRAPSSKLWKAATPPGSRSAGTPIAAGFSMTAARTRVANGVRIPAAIS